MLDRPTLLILLVSLIVASLAVALERMTARRSDWRRLLAVQLVSCLWGAILVWAFVLQYQRLPPRPWTADVLEAEPWELMIWPLTGACLLWPTVQSILRAAGAWRLLVGLAGAAIVLLAALAQSERFQSLHSGNAAWALAAVLAIAANTLSIERFCLTGAARWCLLVLLAQLLTMTALVMTCFGSWGDWCKQVSLALGVIAAVRLMAPTRLTPAATSSTSEPATDDVRINAQQLDLGTAWSTWAIHLALPVSILSATVLMHIRDYSQIALPTLLAPVVFLLPTLIGMLDHFIGVRLGPLTRVSVAAVAAIVLCTLVIGIVIASGASSDEW